MYTYKMMLVLINSRRQNREGTRVGGSRRKAAGIQRIREGSGMEIGTPENISGIRSMDLENITFPMGTATSGPGRKEGFGVYTFRNGESKCGEWDSGVLKSPPPQLTQFSA